MAVDAVDCTLIGMGTASLFPLAGAVSNLKDFFPPRCRAWFVTLSTLFSFGAYFLLQWDFSSLWPYVPLWVSFPIAFLALLAFMLLRVALRDTLSRPKGFRPAASIVICLMFYTTFAAGVTYSFNVLERLRLHDVYYGVVTLQPDDRLAPHAQITFSVGAARKTVTSTFFGYYSQSLDASEEAVFSGVVGEWFNAEGVLTHGVSLDRGQVVSDGFHRLRLVRFDG